ncbi:hypothetical protein Cadr_000007317 [Camelus dromedarius]|uniref:Uncharacterized protein n=1 Tax=Camelus dromedarius TaxID=9838 RepID=A0A5N4E658_CAMDR|nr:hypothetical protein Cadr_000007317 [Camelus dromedarius]
MTQCPAPSAFSHLSRHWFGSPKSTSGLGAVLLPVAFLFAHRAGHPGSCPHRGSWWRVTLRWCRDKGCC